MAGQVAPPLVLAGVHLMKRALSLFTCLLPLLICAVALAAPAGQPDPGFGNAGIRTVGFNQPGGNNADTATSMAKAADGRLYLVGPVTVGPFKYKIGITRLSPDGVVDTSFGTNGRVVYAHPAISSLHVFDAAFQASGRLIVVGGADVSGNQSASFVACGFKPDGTIDSTFGNPETPGCRVAQTSFGGQAFSLAIQPNDGRIVMAGMTTINGTGRAILIRLTANGALDTTFDTDGVVVPYPWLVNHHAFNDVTLSPTGEIVAAGWYDTGAFNDDFLVGRFEPTYGQRDIGFGDGFGY